MSFRTIVRGAIRKSLAFSIGLILVLGGAPGLFAQDSTASIAGVILDPAGKPASGFKVTLRDVASNTQYTSGPTDAAGKYSVKVPVGGRYKIDNVLAADGVTKLAVQDVPPVSVLAAGTTFLNVRFTSTPPTTAVAGAAAAGSTTAAGTTPPASTTPPSDNKKKDKSAVPWYKRPGPIVGMVLGGAAIAALALSGGGGSNNDNNASTYMPYPPPPAP
jgi:hypothetical protein